MKKLYSLLLALALVLSLCTVAMAAGDGGFTVKTQETAVNTIRVTICADAVGLKNSRIVFTYPQSLTLVCAQGKLPEDAGISDLDASAAGTVSFAWAAYDLQKETELLELVFTGHSGTYEATLETPETGRSQTVSLTVPYRFRDVQDPQQWYYDAVYGVYELGLMDGVGGDMFAPHNSLNRATVVTVLHRLAGSPAATGANPFTDVPDNTWYTDAIRWASEAGVVEGYGDGCFAPGRAVTRQEMAVMFCRFRQHQGGDTEADTAVLEEFRDAGTVASWAADAMAWAVEAGIINGMPGSILEPRGGATRAQVAKVLLNYQALP